MLIKYCPSCGKQTLYETGDFDCDEGDKHICYSCGFSAYISVSEPIEYTAKKGKVEQYQPLKTDVEVMLERAYAGLVPIMFGRSVIEDKWREDAAAYSGEKITFRRVPPPEA